MISSVKNCEEEEEYIPQEIEDYNINFDLLDKEDEDGDGVPDIEESITPARLKLSLLQNTNWTLQMLR